MVRSMIGESLGDQGNDSARKERQSRFSSLNHCTQISPLGAQMWGG